MIWAAAAVLGLVAVAVIDATLLGWLGAEEDLEW